MGEAKVQVPHGYCTAGKDERDKALARFCARTLPTVPTLCISGWYLARSTAGLARCYSNDKDDSCNLRATKGVVVPLGNRGRASLRASLFSLSAP